MSRYIAINSRILDETIVLAFDKKSIHEARQEYPEAVVYFPPEIDKIQHLKGNEDAIRKVHAVKKQFAGWIV